MKKTLLICSLGLITHVASIAQSKLIHYWNFNSLTFTTVYTPSVAVIAPDYSDLPTSANAGVVFVPQSGTSSSYYTYVEKFAATATDYDTINFRRGATSGDLIRVHNPSDSMELRLYTPSTHFKNVVLTFGTSRPTNGMKYQNYDYSTDSGATWVTTGLSMLSDSVWSTFQHITLTCANSAVNNNPKLVFRIKWIGNTTGTAGNNRFDNISLDGDTITTAGINLLAEPASYSLYPNPAADKLQIASTVYGSKTVTLMDIHGRLIMEAIAEDRNLSFDTKALNSGCYIIRITEDSTGVSSVLRFVKE